MLKITTLTDDARAVLELEGKLAGAWVEELKNCWHRMDRPVRVQLKAVTFIDSAGRELLTEMYKHGVELAAEGCMTKAIVEEITRGGT
jgi:anti-anti-sigma regulatory factor